MLGAITGDIIGSVYEFNNTKDYKFRLFSPDSSFTDDSVMTMAVAHWLIHDPSHIHQGLEDAMVRFAREFPCPMGGYGGGYLTWLINPSRLHDYEPVHGKLPYKSSTGRHPYGSWGNGSAMRVSPVGWWADSLSETLRLAKISAEVTHNHPEGIKGAQATAAAIFLARTGSSREQIRAYIESTFGYDLSARWEDIQMDYSWDSSCQGTVPQALICALQSTDFTDAIRKAVSMGGDSDTLACITGGIAEAMYGGVPKEILAYVNVFELHAGLLEQFAAVSAYKEVYYGKIK